jgi:transcriptional regulator with XRE-family HTH domain/mannose-6-phosphate isomerase-like protein (cupin superfamily)
MRLGPNLRAARTRRGLTVAELAQAGGLSKGFVSQVENDKTSPSLDTLERLAAALDITVVDLLRGADDAPPAPHVVPGALETPEPPGPVRRVGQPGRLLAAGPVEPALPAVREISPPGAVLRSFVIDLPPGTAVGEPGHRHEGDESLVVLSGALDAEQAGETIHLAVGDALTWTPGRRHRLLNRRPDPARVLVTLVAPATLGAVGVLGSPAPRPVAAPPELRPLRLVQMRAERARRAAR